MRIMDRLMQTSIDVDRIMLLPIGDILIDIDAGHIVVGFEPTDDGPDVEWWTATRYDDEGTESLIYEGTDVAALIRRLLAAR